MIQQKLVEQSLNYHGQQLTKILEGKDDFRSLDLNLKTVDYYAYHQRTNELSLQDRTKRLKLLNFIADKAMILFKKVKDEERTKKVDIDSDEELYAHLPTIDQFMKVNRADRRQQILKLIQQDTLLLCEVVNIKPSKDLMVNVVSILTNGYLQVSDTCVIRAIIPHSYAEMREWCKRDLNICVVREVSNGQFIIGSHLPVHLPKHLCGRIRLGFLERSELSNIAKRMMQTPNETYERMMLMTAGFYNPNNTLYLAEKLGLKDISSSLLPDLDAGFPKSEYADALRKEQASRWAYRSVAKGVQFIREGEHGQAFQHLNQALNVDPTNVEGLVARGALYANKGNYEKAILDFEKALNENPDHKNAKKYMADTLCAQAKVYEDEKEFDRAMEVYQLSLSFAPDHKEVLASIRFLKAMKSGKFQSDDLLKLDNLALPPVKSDKKSELKKQLMALLHEEDSDDDKDSSSKKKKKHNRSSSSSDSSVSDNENTSTNNRRSASLSPLTRRMQMLQAESGNPGPPPHGTPLTAAGFNPVRSQPVDPYAMAPGGQAFLYNAPPPNIQQRKTEEDLEYDEKVRKFLDSLEPGRRSPRRDRRDRRDSSGSREKDSSRDRRDRRDSDVSKEIDFNKEKGDGRYSDLSKERDNIREKSRFSDENRESSRDKRSTKNKEKDLSRSRSSSRERKDKRDRKKPTSTEGKEHVKSRESDKPFYTVKTKQFIPEDDFLYPDLSKKKEEEKEEKLPEKEKRSKRSSSLSSDASDDHSSKGSRKKKYLKEIEKLKEKIKRVREKQEKKHKKKKKKKEKSHHQSDYNSYSSESDYSGSKKKEEKSKEPTPPLPPPVVKSKWDDDPQDEGQKSTEGNNLTGLRPSSPKQQRTGFDIFGFIKKIDKKPEQPPNENIEVKKSSDGSVRIVKREEELVEKEEELDSVQKMKQVFEMYSAGLNPKVAKNKLMIGKRPDVKIQLKYSGAPSPLIAKLSTTDVNKKIEKKSPPPSPYDRRDRSRSRSRSHSDHRHRRRSSGDSYRSRSRSRSYDRYDRRRRSRSYDRGRRSPSYGRHRSRSRDRRSRSRSHGRYYPRRSPPPFWRGRGRGRGGRGRGRGGFYKDSNEARSFPTRANRGFERGGRGGMGYGEPLFPSYSGNTFGGNRKARPISPTGEMFAKLREAKLKIEQVVASEQGKNGKDDKKGVAGGSKVDPDNFSDVEKFIEKGMKDKKKDMIERNKEFLKTQQAK